ncbi:pentapeptide repeat-containing protein [Streptomyces mirabilis]|uniref:pentapeptide repeat-containing protein n=1 Tax=Streptomyces mirabilis TaxID=68239 RepID=UPI0036BFE3ED
MKTHPDTSLGRLVVATRLPRPWLRIQASNWWTRVLLAGGARHRSLRGADLRGADLSEADPSDADLVGVTWSERTRWSVAVATLMRARSVPIGGGRYRVQGSGNSGADLSVPPVPVS